jgi:TIGR03009 family protein
MYRNQGVLVYERPDRGTFKVEEVGVWNGKTAKDEIAWPVKEDAYGEHFVCDGEKVYIYNHRAKQLEISPIPPEMRGKQIVDGPLPFLFGAEAAKIKHRYWVRTTDSNDAQIWLDVRPKFAEDASNYRQVEVILDRKELLPTAIKVYRPNGDEDVYMFRDADVNNPLSKFIGIFTKPDAPWGWDVVEHPLPQQAQQPQGQHLPREAQRKPGLPRY